MTLCRRQSAAISTNQPSEDQAHEHTGTLFRKRGRGCAGRRGLCPGRNLEPRTQQRESKTQSYDQPPTCTGRPPQSFFIQMMPAGKAAFAFRERAQTAAFKRIVKKEPKYSRDHPFRGVAKLGSQEYAFALERCRRKRKRRTQSRRSEKAKTQPKPTRPSPSSKDKARQGGTSAQGAPSTTGSTSTSITTAI